MLDEITDLWVTENESQKMSHRLGHKLSLTKRSKIGVY